MSRLAAREDRVNPPAIAAIVPGIHLHGGTHRHRGRTREPGVEVASGRSAGLEGRADRRPRPDRAVRCRAACRAGRCLFRAAHGQHRAAPQAIHRRQRDDPHPDGLRTCRRRTTALPAAAPSRFRRRHRLVEPVSREPRLPVSTEPVRVGETLEISGTIPLPDIEDFQLEVDLVAEAIVWFEFVGSQPVKLHFRKRAYVDNS